MINRRTEIALLVCTSSTMSYVHAILHMRMRMHIVSRTHVHYDLVVVAIGLAAAPTRTVASFVPLQQQAKLPALEVAVGPTGAVEEAARADRPWAAVATTDGARIHWEHAADAVRGHRGR